MADVTFDEVAKLADQLPEPEQLKLIDHLRTKQARQKTPVITEDPGPSTHATDYADWLQTPTREELIQELQDLRARGAFDNVESLYGRYANPNAPDLSETDLHAELKAIATEWEQELDEFDTNHN